MRFSFSSMRSLCAPVALALLGGAALSLSADSIIITRPLVAIVAPDKEIDSIPKARRTEEISFAAPLQQPLVPSHQIIQRAMPRSNEDDEEEKIHPLLRDPKKLPGIFGKDPLKAPSTLAERNNPLRLPWRETEEKKEESRSLSPVNSLDWDDRDSRQDRKDGLAEKSWRREEQEYGQQFDPFRSRQERVDQRADPLRAPMSFEPMAWRPREKPTAAELEKRAAFQELINPQGAMAAKQSGSLEPVTAFESPEPLVPRQGVPTPAPVPTTSPNPAMIGRGPMDPHEAFQRRQARLVGGDFEDPAKPFSVGNQTKPSRKVAEPLRQTPLLREPIQREIPTRQF